MTVHPLVAKLDQLVQDTRADLQRDVCSVAPGLVKDPARLARFVQRIQADPRAAEVALWLPEYRYLLERHIQNQALRGIQ